MHLYAFDNIFDPNFGNTHNLTDTEKIAYREKYRLLKFEGMPDRGKYSEKETKAISQFLKTTFIAIADYLVGRHPNAAHHLVNTGHGSPGGWLFGGQLEVTEARLFLKSWTSRLGRNLGVVDLGGPCNKASLSDMDTNCPYADYYIASDLGNGGYMRDNWSSRQRDGRYNETDPGYQYHRLFSESSNLRQVLSDRVDLIRNRYKQSRNDMIKNKVEQGNYLFSCSSYSDFSNAFKKFMSGKTRFHYPLGPSPGRELSKLEFWVATDVLNYLEKNNASKDIIDKYKKMIIHSANNKDFFVWEITSNGLLMEGAQFY